MPTYQKAQATPGQDTAGHRPESANQLGTDDAAVRHLQDTMLNAASALEAFRNALAIVNAQASDAVRRLGRIE
ncbi:MAG: hypothetical protein ABTR92_19740 [Candidatus Accumulibacter phosphatis]